MKFLEVPNFATLSAHLSGTREGTRINCQIESYSLKPAGMDKKMYKDYNYTNGHSPDQMLALSPPQTTIFATSSDQMTNRKTIYHLLCTLNAAYPDYDFQHVDSKQFSKEPNLELVINAVNNTLRETNRDACLAVQSEIWAAIDSEIELSNCEIYSYIPQDDSDPFGEEGVVYVSPDASHASVSCAVSHGPLFSSIRWHFNYFFLNHKLKRLVMFACRGIR